MNRTFQYFLINEDNKLTRGFESMSDIIEYVKKENLNNVKIVQEVKEIYISSITIQKPWTLVKNEFGDYNFIA